MDERMKARRLAEEREERTAREIEARHEKHPLKGTTLPARFEPRFWDQADGRIATIKEVRRRYEALKQDTQADSCQKDLLCQRATFVACQLETMEVIATETGKFDMGVYCQAVNTLLGLLRSLGLERKARNVDNLQSYVASKNGRERE